VDGARRGRRARSVRRGGSAYGFRHALAREAVYAELLAPERRALHASLAAAIEAAFSESERGAVEWAALAHHWDAADDARRALVAAIAAGEAATTVYAFADAQRQLERARRLRSEVAASDRPKGVDEPELLRQLAEAARLAGRWDEAIPIAEAALAVLPPATEPPRAAVLELLLSTLHRDTDVAVGHARRALELLPPGPSAERSAAVLRMAAAHVYGDVPSAQ
jgi:predicted ATPase